jgi:hypothetical protein
MLKHRFLPILIQKRIPLPKSIILIQSPLKQLHHQLKVRESGYGADASVIGEHESTYPVTRLQVRTPSCHGDLDTCGAPGDKGCESAFADSEEGFVDFGWVCFALDDV